MPRLYSAIIGGSGSGSGGALRSGTQAISNGSNTVAVIFGTSVSSTSYSISFSISNAVDADPIYLQGIVTTKTTSGFTVQLNAPADSANYVLTYSISDYV